MPRYRRSLVWFRRDLRDHDHAALHHALRESEAVFCAFVFDDDVLQALAAQHLNARRRASFIVDSLHQLDRALRAKGGGLIIRCGSGGAEILRLATQLQTDAVFVNRDYGPYPAARDAEVDSALQRLGQRLLSFKDQVIFETDEVLTQAGRPFAVFTPYRNAWQKCLLPDEQAASAPAAQLPQLGRHLADWRWQALATPPAELAAHTLPQFDRTDLSVFGIDSGMSGARRAIADFMPRLAMYETLRDRPAAAATSGLSMHLRFGTVSIRALVRLVLDAMRSGEGGSGARAWLAALVWRDFHFMILHHFPHVVGAPFRARFARIEWESGAVADEHFDAWCEGRTGYPLVDAAMLQLRRSGTMHNRLRMVTASFLVKDLGIDWRRGERHFAETLNDYDLAANNGGWQWCASTGCDAQPWFRIFNPVTQSQRFDPNGIFIRSQLPLLSGLAGRDIHAPWLLPPALLLAAGVELGGNYPLPLVDHDEARSKTLQRYAVVRNAAG